MRDFVPGDLVEFELVGPSGTVPRFNLESDRTCKPWNFSAQNPPKWQPGVVVFLSDEDKTFITEWIMSGGNAMRWTWYQPSAPKAMQHYLYSRGCGYVRLKVAASATALNNDGRATCYACKGPTRTFISWYENVEHRVCIYCGK